jgi:dTMP kinase
VGVLIRDIVRHHRGEVSPRAEALLYAADRAHHIETVVRPALARGDVVIQDRYLDSSVAYQGAGRVLGRDEVRQLSLWATEGLLPELTVLLDLDPVTARARLDADDKPFDRLEAEKESFHARVREEFLALAAAERARFLVLDAAQPPAELAAAVRDRVASLL